MRTQFGQLLGILALSILLVGCAHRPLPVSSSDVAQVLQVAATAGDKGDEASEAAAESSIAVEALPKVELNPKILYQLLMSEIAAQRGIPDAAVAIQLNLAMETRDPRIARRATEFAIAMGQPGAALQAARLWSGLSPNSAEANQAVLTILVSGNRLDEAEPLMRRMLAGSENKLPVFGQIHGLLSRSPDQASALALYERLAADHPKTPEVHMMLAQIAQNAGEKAKAIEHVRTAGSLRRDWDIATIMLAQYLQADSPREAEQALIAYLARHPESIEVRIAYTSFLVNEQRKNEATAQFERLLTQQPTNPETVYALGMLSYKAGNPSESERFFQRFVDLSRTVGTPRQRSSISIDGGMVRSPNGAYLFLAQLAEDRRDYARALDWLSQIQDGNELLNARIRRATILSQNGKLDQAREELSEYSASSPRERVQLTIAEAALLRDAHQDVAAFDLLNSALTIQPENPELLYEQGMMAVKLNRIDVMETSMRTLIRVRPAHPHGYNALGYTLADHNVRLDEAKALIEKAVSLAPDDPSIIDSLGWVNFRLGNIQLAIEHLQRAYKLRGDAEVAAHLGEALWVGGRRAEAEKIWGEAERKEPANEALRETLRRLNANVGALHPPFDATKPR